MSRHTAKPKVLVSAWAYRSCDSGIRNSAVQPSESTVVVLTAEHARGHGRPGDHAVRHGRRRPRQLGLAARTAVRLHDDHESEHGDGHWHTGTLVGDTGI